MVSGSRADRWAVGVVSAYPIVSTGGCNRALWQPASGVQTLRLLHRRVDLSPLVTMLNDGETHTV